LKAEKKCYEQQKRAEERYHNRGFNKKRKRDSTEIKRNDKKKKVERKQ